MELTPHDLEPRKIALLGPRGAIEELVRSRRTALLLLDRGARVGEIWLDRGRILCSMELAQAAAALAELLAWPAPHVTVVAGARRAGPCVAIPAAVLLHRADEIGQERLAMLSLLADPTELHVASDDASARDGDVHEAAVLAAVSRGETPFGIVPLGHGRAEIADAIVRLVRRRAIVRRQPPVVHERASHERTSGRATVPGPSSATDGPITRLFGWVRSSFDAAIARPSIAPDSARELASPSPRLVPGWRASEARDAEAAAPRETGAEWVALPWDRDRAAIGATATSVAERLLAALAIERGSADLETVALIERARDAVSRGLEDVPAISPLAADLRQAIASETTAREVAQRIASDERIARVVLREASAAAFGRAPTSLEQAVVRVGLARVHRVAVAPILVAPAFEARVLGARARRARMACQLAGELAAELGEPSAREELFLAGLLHGLGRLYLATLADRCPGISLARLEELCCQYQSSFGVLLAARWSLGSGVARAIGAHADESPLELGRPRAEGDRAPAPSVLRAAQIVACAMTEEPPVPDWRIARALRPECDADATATTGPLFDRARALLRELA